VVIPAFDARRRITACLDALAGDPVVGRVIVVDDGSADGTADLVRARRGPFELVALDRSRGLAHALNRGLERCRADHVLFLNDDVVAGPGSVAALRDALARQPAAVMAGGRLVEPDGGQTQWRYQPRALPGLAALLVRILGVERIWPRNPWTGQHLRAPLVQDRPTLHRRQPAGACLIVRRDLMHAVGGWDEGFWFWYEDVDLAARLLRQGPALYVPQAAFAHIGAASTDHFRKPEQHARLYRGTLRYATLHLGSGRRRTLAAVLAVACGARWAGARLAGDAGGASTYRALTGLAVSALTGSVES
jgi:GT2 family glycosyltransferase